MIAMPMFKRFTRWGGYWWQEWIREAHQIVAKSIIAHPGIVEGTSCNRKIYHALPPE